MDANISDQHFLYVDDDPMSREALTIVLKRVMRVQNLTVFEDSTEILRRVKALPTCPDMILLDIHMTPHTGFEVLKMLRGDPMFARIKIIALTASVMNEEVELLRQCGFDGVIGKPINVTGFPLLIERVYRGESIWHITDGE